MTLPQGGRSSVLRRELGLAHGLFPQSDSGITGAWRRVAWSRRIFRRLPNLPTLSIPKALLKRILLRRSATLRAPFGHRCGLMRDVPL